MQDFPPFHDSIFNGGGGGLVGYPALASPQNRPPPPLVKCPRCDSTNTKFCYYNNYNLSQPRHFCKACRRYWTMGGVLRNVPVGGGCRKSKRSSRATSPSVSADKNASRHSHPPSAARSNIDYSTGTASPITVVSASAPFSNSLFLASQICVPNPNPRLGRLPHSDPLLPVATMMEAPSVDGMTTIPPAHLGFIFLDQSPAREKGEAESIGLEYAVKLLQSVGGLRGLAMGSRIQTGLSHWSPHSAISQQSDPSSYWNQSRWSDSETLSSTPR